jgi:hypothetical protein
MSSTNLTGRENLTKYASWLGPIGPTDKENQVTMYEKYRSSYITSLKRQGSGSISTVRSGNQIEKQDPDLYHSEKQDPDPSFKNGPDSRHCI